MRARNVLIKIGQVVIPGLPCLHVTYPLRIIKTQAIARSALAKLRTFSPGGAAAAVFLGNMTGAGACRRALCRRQ